VSDWALEGGPRGVAINPSTWTGFTVSRISKADNKEEGLKLAAFKMDSRCGLTEATGNRATILGVPFLVVPMPGSVNTTHVCRGSL